MKKLFSIAFLVFFYKIVGMESPEKRLVLHFDVNKTLIAMDLVQGKTREDTINGILAEFTDFKWDGTKKQSYYAYLSDQIAQEKPTLDRTSDEFKKERNIRLKNFPKYLEKNNQTLHKLYQYEKGKLLKILDAKKMVIFPSFFTLIDWLNGGKYKDNYTLHLRTFGTDLPEVIPLIEQRSKLQFAARAGFKGQILRMFKDKLGRDPQEDEKNIMVHYEPSQLYSLFHNQSAAHYAIQDDYTYWKSKAFQAEGGKLFPVDISNKIITDIFFDDNANDQEKPIIHPIKPDGTLEDTQTLIALGNIVPVDPKEAILNPCYFIKKIEDILKKKEKSLPFNIKKQTLTGPQYSFRETFCRNTRK